MHAGKNFSLKQVVFWTRRDIIFLLTVATVPTFCFVILDWHWLAIPWLPIALLGTAVAFVVGFKNNACYDRLWEGRKAWGGIVNASRSFGIMINDYVSNAHASNKISEEELKQIKHSFLQRHFAWLTALRYQLREPRAWEAINKRDNQDYKNRWYAVEEHETKVEDALLQYLSPEEVKKLMSQSNKAAQIIAKQSSALKDLLDRGLIEDFRHMELEKILIEFYNHQGVCERIKNFPYPRQFATVNLYFIRIFVILVPLGMLQEFDKLGGHLVWLSIPFSTLSTWIFTTLEKIGESTESPFEGSPNDVPITAMSRAIEIDLREMSEFGNIPAPIKPQRDILI